MDGRRGSPSRSGSAVAAKRQVGILCHWVKVNYEIKLFLVDIDRQFLGEEEEEEYALVTPAVRFCFPDPDRDTTLAVCILQSNSNSNSTVYMFGGYNPHPRSPNRPKVKYAAKYELSDKVILDGNLEVKEEELVQIPSKMKYVKGKPRAIPTPDGKKILVFETSIRCIKTYRGFELYDPQNDSWEVLPEIPAYCFHTYRWPESESEPEPEPEAEAEAWTDSDTSDSDFEDRNYHYCNCFIVVSSYSFIDESHFFVESEENGSFILDLETRKWTRLYVRLVPNPHDSFDIVPFVTAKGQYAISPDGIVRGLGDGGFLSERAVVKSSEDVKLSPFAQLSSDNCMLTDLFPSVVPLPPFVKGQVCTTCFLQPQLDYSSMEIRILIDVCHTNLTTLDTELSKCVKLRTKFSGYVYEFTVISV